MSASNEPQSTEKVAQVSQDAIPAAQGEGSAGSSKEVPATLNEAGTLAADGDKSAREGRSHIQDQNSLITLLTEPVLPTIAPFSCITLFQYHV